MLKNLSGQGFSLQHRQLLGFTDLRTPVRGIPFPLPPTSVSIQGRCLPSEGPPSSCRCLIASRESLWFGGGRPISERAHKTALKSLQTYSSCKPATRLSRDPPQYQVRKLGNPAGRGLGLYRAAAVPITFLPWFPSGSRCFSESKGFRRLLTLPPSP